MIQTPAKDFEAPTAFLEAELTKARAEIARLTTLTLQLEQANQALTEGAARNANALVLLDKVDAKVAELEQQYAAIAISHEALRADNDALKERNDTLMNRWKDEQAKRMRAQNVLEEFNPSYTDEELAQLAACLDGMGEIGPGDAERAIRLRKALKA